MYSYWITMGYNPTIGAFKRNLRHKDTQGRSAYENRGRDWSNASTSQRATKMASNHQKLGESQRTDFPSEPPEEPIFLTRAY